MTAEAIKLYLEPYRENLYIFQKRYGKKIRVTQVKFDEFINLYPSNMVSTGKWAKMLSDEFLEELYKNGVSHEASAHSNPDAYKSLNKMYNNYPDFEGWSYNVCERLKSMIEKAISDKKINPMWYVPKDVRMPWRT